MDKDKVLEVVRRHTLETLRTLRDADFEPAKSLADMGADSLDIVDIVTASMRELRVRVPREQLGKARNIQELVDIVAEHGQPIG
jgi:acyl carrier protein